MSMRKPGKKALPGKREKHLPTENVHSLNKNLKENDKELVEEIKRIKKLQKGLYKEYEIGEIGDD